MNIFMNKKDFIKIILDEGTINENIHLKARNYLKGFLDTQSFLQTLQEIDSSVYKYYVPMDYQYEILNGKINLYSLIDLKDINKQRSIFTASSIKDLEFAKISTLNELDIFFKKVRFYNSLFDRQIKNITNKFIYEYVEAKFEFISNKNPHIKLIY